jgi:hypothetical protein
MLAKRIGLVVAGAALAMFAMGRVQSLAAHRGFGGSVAWAQSWDDQGDDAALDSEAPTAPDVSGSYSGQIEDHRKGSGSISATIAQTGKDLSGTWSSDIKGSGVEGKLTGTVNSKGDVALTLKIHGKGGCSLDAKGTFEGGDEISAVYVANGCHHSDHGTIDMTD